MRGADLIVELLIQHGVKHIFGVPGDTSMAFHDALRLRQKEITHILCRDERHAAYAADAYARMTGRIGVVEVPSGGGALYVVPGVSEADLSNIPLLCIASDITMSSDETYALTDCHQEALFAAVTKWNTKLRLLSKIPQMMRKAIRVSTSGSPGAVALSFPENLLRGEYDGKPEEIYGNPDHGRLGYFQNDATDEDVERAIELMKQSKRPVLLAGGGVHFSKAYDELTQLVEKYNIPVVSSIDGKGSVAETKDYALGTIGANGGSLEANEVISQADFIFVLGCKLDNVTTVGKSIFAPGVKILQVDINEQTLGNIAPISHGIMCDIRHLLVKLNKRDCGIDKEAAAAWQEIWAAKRQEKMDRIGADYDKTSDYVVAARVFGAVEKFTDGEAIFTGDAGTPTPYIASYIKMKQTGKHTVIPRAHGALGYAMGAAIGAQVARPQSRVVSFFGDASFAMTMGELETAKRLNLPIVFVNFQNNSYGWIKTIQHLYYDQQYFGVDFCPIDTVMVSQGFGIKAKNVTKNEDVESAVQWALSLQEPVLLNFVIEPPDAFVPPVQQWEVDARKDPADRKKLVY